MTREDFMTRYEAAAHKVQTAIGFLIEHEKAFGVRFASVEPKHMRTGIDLTKADQGSLTGLLIKKGLITEDELFEALAEGMEREAESYQKTVQEKVGQNVTIGLM